MANKISETTHQIYHFVAAESGHAKDIAERFGNGSHVYLRRLINRGLIVRTARGMYAVKEENQ